MDAQDQIAFMRREKLKSSLNRRYIYIYTMRTL